MSTTGEMKDKICLVTGASSGLGKATATGFAKINATTVMVCRDEKRGNLARTEIMSDSGNQSVDLMIADMSSLSSVRQLVTDFNSKYSEPDLLVNNAAVFVNKHIVTPEGFEMMFATNFLGPFQLSRLLLPRLEAAKPARIINVTAPSTTKPDFNDLQGERRFSAVRAFGASKAADLSFTFALARRFEGRGVAVNAYHPGIVRTNLMRGAPAPLHIISSIINLIVGISAERASEGLVRLASASEFEKFNGQLIHDSKAVNAPFANDIDAQERLWQAGCKLTGLPDTL